MRVNRLKWAGNTVRIFENKIRKWLLHGSLGGRRIRSGEKYRQIAQQEEYEVGKDAAKLLNKNCRVTAKHMSDRRKQKGGHGPETGREAVCRRRRNLMNHHKLTNY
jgi:hypothetical protein